MYPVFDRHQSLFRCRSFGDDREWDELNRAIWVGVAFVACVGTGWVSDVNKDLTFKAKDKDKDQTLKAKDHDKDQTPKDNYKDQTFKAKDQDKD